MTIKSSWTPDIYSTEARAHPSAVHGSVACRRWLMPHNNALARTAGSHALGAAAHGDISLTMN